MPETTLSRVKQPEYTGENRCMPCSVVNVLVAIALSAGVWAVGVRAGAATLGAVAGGGVFAVSLAAIYLRGYLVPGTPTLTERYLPEWLLSLFGKRADPAPTADVDPDEADADEVLRAAGALDATGGGDLDDAFRAEWTEAIERAADVDRDTVRAGFDAGGDAEVHRTGGVYRVYVDGSMLGKWQSRAAFVTDLGSEAVLSERFDGWDDLPLVVRADALARLRKRVETCPDCGGATEHGTETIDGCCGTVEATTVSCRDCSTQLYVETCPECGDGTELGTETVEVGDGGREVASVTCLNCDRWVSMLPGSIPTP